MLHPSAPFNFDGTVHKPSHFPSSDNDYQKGIYWQTMRHGGRALGLRMANKGSIDDPLVGLTIYAEKKIPADEIRTITRELEYRLHMTADLGDFYEQFTDDDILGPVIERWRGMRVMVNASLYEFLVIATVLQNATVRRSTQMLENLFQKYGTKVAFSRKELTAYWAPEAIDLASDEELRALKVGYRSGQLKRQARPFVSGDLDELRLRTLPSDELRTLLLDIYGIGPASVWYVMFEVFKRYDALDYISPWEQKIYSRLLFDKELVDCDVILDEVGARWGQWKMLAVHYIFEDLFWRRRNEPVPWLEELIRL